MDKAHGKEAGKKPLGMSASVVSERGPQGSPFVSLSLHIPHSWHLWLI